MNNNYKRLVDEASLKLQEHIAEMKSYLCSEELRDIEYAFNEFCGGVEDMFRRLSNIAIERGIKAPAEHVENIIEETLNNCILHVDFVLSILPSDLHDKSTREKLKESWVYVSEVLEKSFSNSAVDLSTSSGQLIRDLFASVDLILQIVHSYHEKFGNKKALKESIQKLLQNFIKFNKTYEESVGNAINKSKFYSPVNVDEFYQGIGEINQGIRFLAIGINRLKGQIDTPELNFSYEGKYSNEFTEIFNEISCNRRDLNALVWKCVLLYIEKHWKIAKKKATACLMNFYNAHYSLGKKITCFKFDVPYRPKFTQKRKFYEVVKMRKNECTTEKCINGVYIYYFAKR